jgi:hypothetical protein
MARSWHGLWTPAGHDFGLLGVIRACLSLGCWSPYPGVVLDCWAHESGMHVCGWVHWTAWPGTNWRPVECPLLYISFSLDTVPWFLVWITIVIFKFLCLNAWFLVSWFLIWLNCSQRMWSVWYWLVGIIKACLWLSTWSNFITAMCVWKVFNYWVQGSIKVQWISRRQWLTPVILATQEAEIRRFTVWSQPQANSSRDPISKKPNTKKRLMEWLKVWALSSSPGTAHTKFNGWK